MKIDNDDEIKNHLKTLPGWKFSENGLQKKYQFKDFISNIEAVKRIAIKAEELNHHPDIFIHSWNKLTITLSTHSVGGVTQLDFQLAKEIEEITNESKS